MKKITIIGTGYVGLVSGTGFADIGHQVICADIDEEKIAKLNNGIIPIYEPGLEELVQRNREAGRLHFTNDMTEAIQSSDILFIAVGTPMLPSGEADLSYVRSVAEMIGEAINGYKIVVNKSTVPVGTGKLVREIIQRKAGEKGIAFDVVSNPEFLREGTAIADFFKMERVVIGSESPAAIRELADVHEPLQTTVVETDLETAEMIKYASNAFLAMKISFINDISNICEKVGANVVDLSYGLGLDSRIGSKFLNPGIGFGGSCFPKDTEALLSIAKKAGHPFKLMESVIETNKQQPLLFVKKIEEELRTLASRKIAVLGLAFKPGTDDMRSAPSIQIIRNLALRKAQVQAFDPVAIDNAKPYFSDLPGIRYSTDLYETLEGCDACVILTEWQEIASIDLARLKRALARPIVIDGRNIFDLAEMEAHGFVYVSMGRPKVNAGTVNYV
ncbi:UDP-glucose/GDP-mannose dehydrogenase family protein [Paenibacillus sp. FSL R5-0527]|uniref:UDP-glucose dehydrogenase family protein n=1 Tax=Paenibacillus sp. FSL R5-0527 TaxID=2975321 RepID=UPI00097AD850|nr:UDP-glucose 6-dehydrogenase [Paenibacillus macerans]